MKKILFILTAALLANTMQANAATTTSQDNNTTAAEEISAVADTISATADLLADQTDSILTTADSVVAKTDTTGWGWIKSHLALERRVSEALRAARKKYDVGQAVNLNDYLAWSDSTVDWQNVYIDQETEDWLNDKGVYYDAEHYDWVLRSFPRYALLEKPIYHSVTRTGINNYRSCLCDWELDGRRLTGRLVLPDCDSKAVGTVAVRIYVNKKGEIWWARKMSETTVKDKRLIYATIDAAYQAQFNEGKRQKGIITYHF